MEFSDREIAFIGVYDHARLPVKMYLISHTGDMPSLEDTHQAISTWFLKKGRCPSLDQASAGFAINRRVRGRDYFVFCYWSNTSQCFTDLWVREQTEGARWRRAFDESFCVQDLEVIWHERNAFMRHMMGRSPSTQRYLDDFFEREEAAIWV